MHPQEQIHKQVRIFEKQIELGMWSIDDLFREQMLLNMFDKDAPSPWVCCFLLLSGYAGKGAASIWRVRRGAPDESYKHQQRAVREAMPTSSSKSSNRADPRHGAAAGVPVSVQCDYHEGDPSGCSKKFKLTAAMQAWQQLSPGVKAEGRRRQPYEKNDRLNRVQVQPGIWHTCCLRHRKSHGGVLPLGGGGGLLPLGGGGGGGV